MAREYLVPAWTDAASDHDLWSGKSPDDRKRKSHMLSPNRANTDAYSDASIAELKAQGAAKVSIKDKILPQFKRLTVLQSQMLELENSYRSGEIDIKTYSFLRDIVVAKIQRQEVLLKRASSVKPITQDDDFSSNYGQDDGFLYSVKASTASDNNGHGESYSSPVGVSFFAEVIDELSDTNSLKSFLKMSCKVVRKAVHFSHKARSYWNELKAV